MWPFDKLNKQVQRYFFSKNMPVAVPLYDKICEMYHTSKENQLYMDKLQDHFIKYSSKIVKFFADNPVPIGILKQLEKSNSDVIVLPKKEWEELLQRQSSVKECVMNIVHMSPKMIFDSLIDFIKSIIGNIISFFCHCYESMISLFPKKSETNNSKNGNNNNKVLDNNKILDNNKEGATSVQNTQEVGILERIKSGFFHYCQSGWELAKGMDT